MGKAVGDGVWLTTRSKARAPAPYTHSTAPSNLIPPTPLPTNPRTLLLPLRSAARSSSSIALWRGALIVALVLILVLSLIWWGSAEGRGLRWGELSWGMGSGEAPGIHACTCGSPRTSHRLMLRRWAASGAAMRGQRGAQGRTRK